MRGGARPAGRRCDLLFVVLSPALGSMMFFEQSTKSWPEGQNSAAPGGTAESIISIDLLFVCCTCSDNNAQRWDIYTALCSGAMRNVRTANERERVRAAKTTSPRPLGLGLEAFDRARSPGPKATLLQLPKEPLKSC